VENTKYELSNELKLGRIGQRPVKLTTDELTHIGYLSEDSNLPFVVTALEETLQLVPWTTRNLQFIETQLLKHGAVLFRNFKLDGAVEFERLIKSNSDGILLEYVYGSTPRTRVHGNVYTSTEYPANRVIPQHNEMSYTTAWPMRVWFYCVTPAEKGGETPIADSRKVFSRIDPEIREKFMQKKVMYVRNYGEGLDLSWQKVFQTTQRTKVEEICRKSSIEYEWKDNDRLRTKQICQAVAKYPETGDVCWFNQAHLFHVSSQKPDIYKALLEIYSKEELPRNAYYGDGSDIELEALDNIWKAYDKETVSFPWRRGDVVMADNMLISHGRAPFEGTRRVLVGMANSYSTIT